MEIIGPDCEKIILNYKKKIDFIFNQNKNIINILNKSGNDIRILKTDIDYKDFKKIYLEKNRNNKKIMFSINCYGSDHYMNRKIFDLDLDNDKDDMLYEFRIIKINKNQKKETILIDLYNKKYDYDRF